MADEQPMCEMDGCTRRAGIGIELSLPDSERRATRWLCIPHLPDALETMADMSRTIQAFGALIGNLAGRRQTPPR